AVAAAVVQDGLDVELRAHDDRQGLIAHAGVGAGAVGDVDRVGAVAFEKGGAFDLLRGVAAARGEDLDQGDEAAFGQLLPEAGTLGQGQDSAFGALRLGGGFDVDAAFARRGRADVVADPLDVLGRGAATAADDFGAGGDELAGVVGQVLGRHHVEVAPVHVAGLAGVGLGDERAAGGVGHLLQRFEHAHRTTAAVYADHVGAPALHAARGFGGGGAVEGAALVVNRDLRDQRQGAGVAGAEERLAQLSHL